jgi:hypothetical protein
VSGLTRAAWTPAGPWPTDDERLLLRAALLDRSAALDAWHQFSATHAGIDHLDGDAYRLLPQLFRNLQAPEFEDPALGRLKGIYRQAWYANQLLLQSGSDAVALLQMASVEAMLLGGGALVACHVRDVGARPLDSVDIIVHPDDTERALGVLSTHGWARRGHCSSTELMRSGKAVKLVKGGHAKLTLHWSVLSPSDQGSDIWGAAVMVQLGGVSTLVPSLADQLLLVCVRGLGWTPAPLRWIPDATFLMRSNADRMDWRSLVVRARELQVMLDLADALEFLVAELEFAIPRELLAPLRQRVDIGERVVHRIKMMPPRRAPLWRMVRRIARACDAMRHQAGTPPLHARRRPEKLPMLLDACGARTSRATVPRPGRKAAAWFRRARSRP